MFEFKDYHIILVPKDKSGTRTFKISGFSLKVLVCSAILVVPLFLLSVLSAIHTQNKLVALKSRSFENEELLQSKTELVTKLATLEKNVEHLEENLGSLSGLLDVDPQSLTTGVGPALEADGSSSLDYALSTVDIDSIVSEWFDDNANISLNRFNKRVEDLRSQTFDLNAAIRAMVDDNKGRIKFASALPDKLPVKGWITSDFGVRKHPIHHVMQMHYGLDLAAPYGSPILAPSTGVVAFAGPTSGYGNMIVLDHGYGVTTTYAHASSLTVRKGEKVAPGQQIANVGTTGSSTGPHLHYEVHVDGVAVDPKPYIPKL